MVACTQQNPNSYTRAPPYIKFFSYLWSITIYLLLYLYILTYHVFLLDYCSLWATELTSHPHHSYARWDISGIILCAAHTHTPYNKRQRQTDVQFFLLPFSSSFFSIYWFSLFSPFRSWLTPKKNIYIAHTYVHTHMHTHTEKKDGDLLKKFCSLSLIIIFSLIREDNMKEIKNGCSFVEKLFFGARTTVPPQHQKKMWEARKNKFLCNFAPLDRIYFRIRVWRGSWLFFLMVMITIIIIW